MSEPTANVVVPVRQSESWDELVERYSQFCELPAWRANGKLMPSGGRNEVQKKLLKMVSIVGPHVPRPTDFSQEHVRLVFPEKPLDANNVTPPRTTPAGEFWRAFILDKDVYTCAFCGRNAFRVFIEERLGGEAAILRLQLDHLVPRAQMGATLTLSNIRCLCKSCNTVRGQAPDQVALDELRSLSLAILQRQSVKSL